MQRTLGSEVGFEGVGLHSGRPVRMRIKPAGADHGIVFHRTDLGPKARVAALWDRVVPSTLCTELRGAEGVSVSTVEHVMAALAGLGIGNALIEIDGPEVPILDGSSAIFVSAILRRGLRELPAPLRAIRILEEVTVTRGDASASLSPAPGFYMDFSIDFADAAIGRQSRRLNMANGTFLRELADCRTFCRKADVDAMHERGLALGGTLENAVVFDGADVLSPGGLRRADEPVRHKMLDALGDLALAGAPLIGRYSGNRAGHALTNQLLRSLFARPSAWRLETCDAVLAARLPGKAIASADLAAVA